MNDTTINTFYLQETRDKYHECIVKFLNTYVSCAVKAITSA